MQQFQASSPVAITPPAPRTTATRWTPARPPTVAADVGVPLLSALALGALIALAWAAVAMKLTGKTDVLDIIIAAAITSAATFVTLLSAERPLRWAWEERTHVDLDGDGIIGKPPAPAPEIQVIRDPILIRTHEGNNLVISTLVDGNEVEQAKMLAFVQGMHDRGLTLNAARMCDLVREEWDSIINHGVQIGLWTDKSQGIDAMPLVTRQKAVRRMLETTSG